MLDSEIIKLVSSVDVGNEECSIAGKVAADSDH